MLHERARRRLNSDVFCARDAVVRQARKIPAPAVVCSFCSAARFVPKRYSTSPSDTRRRCSVVVASAAVMPGATSCKRLAKPPCICQSGRSIIRRAMSSRSWSSLGCFGSDWAIFRRTFWLDMLSEDFSPLPSESLSLSSEEPASPQSLESASKPLPASATSP